jgi:hypothetical protein
LIDILAFKAGPVYNGGSSQIFSQLQKVPHKKKMQTHPIKTFLNPKKPDVTDMC